MQECGGETLDCGASKAFALCDHQIAHIHLESAKDINEVLAMSRTLTPRTDRTCRSDDQPNLWCTR
jgi:hypothetical protein